MQAKAVNSISSSSSLLTPLTVVIVERPKRRHKNLNHFYLFEQRVNPLFSSRRGKDFHTIFISSSSTSTLLAVKDCDKKFLSRF